MEQDYNITPSGYIYGRDPKSTVPFWNVDTLKSLNEEIDKLNGDIDNLQLEIERLESENQTLEDNISNFPNRFFGSEPFPDNYTLNFTVPSNWDDTSSPQIILDKLKYITCNNININYLENSSNGNYQQNYSLSNTLDGLNCNYLNLLYPNVSSLEISTIINFKSRPDIHKMVIKTNKNINPSRVINIPIFVKHYLFNKYIMNQSIFEIQMLSSGDTSNYVFLLSRTNSSASSINPYSNQCIILNYGNRTINSINVLLQDNFSDSTEVSPAQALAQSGLVFFVSDQNYDLFMSDSNWSQLGNNLRRLSEFNEEDW